MLVFAQGCYVMRHACRCYGFQLNSTWAGRRLCILSAPAKRLDLWHNVQELSVSDNDISSTERHTFVGLYCRIFTAKPTLLSDSWSACIFIFQLKIYRLLLMKYGHACRYPLSITFRLISVYWLCCIHIVKTDGHWVCLVTITSGNSTTQGRMKVICETSWLRLCLYSK